MTPTSRAALENLLGRVLFKLVEPITKEVLNHLFAYVDEDGIAHLAWVDDLLASQETIRKVLYNIPAGAKCTKTKS